MAHVRLAPVLLAFACVAVTAFPADAQQTAGGADNAVKRISARAARSKSSALSRQDGVADMCCTSSAIELRNACPVHDDVERRPRWARA